MCPYDLRRASFHGVIGPLNPQHHHRALFAFQTHRTVGSGFPSLATILRSYCQPCGDQGVLCHATSPHGLVPLIKRSRIPGHLVKEGDGSQDVDVDDFTSKCTSFMRKGDEALPESNPARSSRPATQSQRSRRTQLDSDGEDDEADDGDAHNWAWLGSFYALSTSHGLGTQT